MHCNATCFGIVPAQAFVRRFGNELRGIRENLRAVRLLACVQKPSDSVARPTTLFKGADCYEFDWDPGATYQGPVTGYGHFWADAYRAGTAWSDPGTGPSHIVTVTLPTGAKGRARPTFRQFHDHPSPNEPQSSVLI
jgi:hypothetical protein